MLIDTHVHFDRFEVEGTLEETLERAREAGVVEMMAVGGTPEANARSRRLARAFPGRIYACAGYDRDEAERGHDLGTLREEVADPLVKAVGETGLDYHYSPENARAQRSLFGAHLEMAVAFGKPVVVHSREADEDTLAMLAEYAGAWTGDPARLGVLHCFTRDRAVAKRLLDLGLMISFSGIVTFANADALREVAAYVPADRLLIETDSPYLAPVPMRGKRNEPSFVLHVAERLAQLREVPLESLAEITSRNARELFGLQRERTK